MPIQPNYSLALFSPAIEDQSFVLNLTRHALDWKRSIRADGGYWVGTFTMNGSINDLARAFYNWLGRHVEERCSGVVSWEGLIYEMELSYAGVRRRRSLDLMTKYVSMYYVDPARVEYQTPWGGQAQSYNRYGRKEEIDWLDDMTYPAAVAQRNRILSEMAWPWARPLSVYKDSDTELSITVCGYAFTANWRYTTQNTEFDTEQGALTYAATTFTDAGQDFSAWDTAAPGTAQYSVWVTNDDSTLTWAYIGDLNGGNTRIDTYTDQALTVGGWNGAGVGGKTPAAYYVRGGASELISDIVGSDCEYLSAGSIDTNYVQVNRILQRDQRAWDVMMDAVDMGDTDGNPYRLWVQADRKVMYNQVDTTPRYYLRGGGEGIFTSIGSRAAISPWLVQPAVFRDMAFTVARDEQGSWLNDARDIYVEEVQVDGDGTLTLKTSLYSEGDLLAAQAKAMQRYPHRPRPERK